MKKRLLVNKEGLSPLQTYKVMFSCLFTLEFWLNLFGFVFRHKIIFYFIICILIISTLINFLVKSTILYFLLMGIFVAISFSIGIFLFKKYNYKDQVYDDFVEYYRSKK